jgi:small subunit ribosomal protein S1
MENSEFQDPNDQNVDTPAQLQESSFGDILSEFEKSQEAAGSTENVQGTVILLSEDYVVIDIGKKLEGVIPIASMRDRDGVVAAKPGDQVVATIIGRAEGYYLLSPLEVRQPKDWSGLQKAFDEKQIISGEVKGIVKGGFNVDVGVRAFLPGSRSGIQESEALSYIGQQIRCRIIKLDVEHEDVVVDRRAVLEEEERAARQKRYEELQESAVVKGTVRTLTDFGAFVDLGGIDGLLHVSDMSWGRIGKPSDMVKEGDELEVKVLKVDSKGRRISLGLKQLQPDPWSLASEKYHSDQRLQGRVARLADFGAFVELEPGLEGLIHLSEMSWSKRIRKPADLLKVGETVEVQVLNVNAADKRIALGLKQVVGDPWEAIESKYPVGSVVEGPVTSLAKFGAFIQVSEDIEGMIHIGDITAEKRLDHPQDVLRAGQVVKAAVTEIDRERRRLRLSMKQLEPTSIDEYIAEHKTGDTVSGRIIDSGRDVAKVELGEGVLATCRLPKEEREAAPEAEAPAPAPRAADLSSLTAMLSAKWKEGKAPGSAASGKKDKPRSGQIRTFRIIQLDPAKKQIEVEMVS